MFTMCDVSAQEFAEQEDAHGYAGYHTITRDKTDEIRERTRWAVDETNPTYQKVDESGNLVKFRIKEMQARVLQAGVFYKARNYVSHFNAYPS